LLLNALLDHGHASYDTLFAGTVPTPGMT